MGVGQLGQSRPASHRAVFVDRDGVLNRSLFCGDTPVPPSTRKDLEILEGVPEALTRLRNAGFWVVVVTNQPDVARGRIDREEVDAIHRHMLETLAIDRVDVCFHDDADACTCRKPMPGALYRAAGQLGLDLEESFMIGDRWRDIEAGQRAHCTTILIGDGHGEDLRSPPDQSFQSLLEAVSWILNNGSSQEEGRHEKD